jgi:hypothetical protein
MAEDEHQDEEKSRVLESSEPEPGQGGEERLPEVAAAAGSAGSAGAAGVGGSGGRLGELTAKRRTTGLSDAEAEELGTLLAEQEGKPHSSAQSLKRGPAAEE